MVALARLLQDLGRLDEALAELREAARTLEEVLGEEHFEVGKMLNDLGSLHENREELVEAEATYRRSLEVLSGIPGPPPDAAVVAGNLGLLLVRRGELDEAAPLLERSLAEHEAAFGRDHPRLVPIFTGLGKLALARTNADAHTLARLERAVAIADSQPVDDDARKQARDLLERLRRAPIP